MLKKIFFGSVFAFIAITTGASAQTASITAYRNCGNMASCRALVTEFKGTAPLVNRCAAGALGIVAEEGFCKNLISTYGQQYLFAQPICATAFRKGGTAQCDARVFAPLLSYLRGLPAILVAAYR